jgi:hypothetical protein
LFLSLFSLPDLLSFHQFRVFPRGVPDWFGGGVFFFSSWLVRRFWLSLQARDGLMCVMQSSSASAAAKAAAAHALLCGC